MATQKRKTTGKKKPATKKPKKAPAKRTTKKKATKKPAGGRPTKYQASFCQKLVDYFDVEPYREVEVIVTYRDGREETRYEERPNDLPTLAGFARSIGVHRDTLHEWTTKYPEFSDAIKKAKAIQEDVWVTNCLKGHYNTTFGIFFGKNNLEYKDKYEVEQKNPATYSELEENPKKAKTPEEARQLAEQDS